MEKYKKGIIVGASSDIGKSLTNFYLKRSCSIVGTYRSISSELRQNRQKFKALIKCDMSNKKSVNRFTKKIKDMKFEWEFIFLCPGTMEPIGKFDQTPFDWWEENLKINLVNQLRILHDLIPIRNKNKTIVSKVILFAGGGTNSAPINFSAYTISKIALIKAVEILDSEYKDISFSILGPGWVKTKIHKETFKAGKKSGKSLRETLDRFEKDNFNPIENVIACCDWAINSPKEIVGGRNISIVYDAWGSKELDGKLKTDLNLYKLRRYGN